MKSRLCACTALLLCFFLGAACRSFADPDGAAQEIEKILHVFERAYLEEDVKLISTVLSDAYVMVLPGRASQGLWRSGTTPRCAGRKI